MGMQFGPRGSVPFEPVPVEWIDHGDAEMAKLWRPMSDEAFKDGRPVILFVPNDAPNYGGLILREWSNHWDDWENEYHNGPAYWLKPTRWMPAPAYPPKSDALA